MPNLARNGRRGGIKNKALGNYPGAFNILICGGYGQSTDRRRAC